MDGMESNKYEDKVETGQGRRERNDEFCCYLHVEPCKIVVCRGVPMPGTDCEYVLSESALLKLAEAKALSR